jgi:hypothetical protein
MRSVLFVLLAVALVPINARAAQQSAQNSTAKRISNHIQQSGQLRNYRIGVTYQSGMATLAGTVTSPEQRDAAIRLAKEVNGVKRVDCQLECVGAGDSPLAGSDSMATPAEFHGDGGGIVQAIGEQQPNRARPPAWSERTQLQNAAGQQRPTMFSRGGSGPPRPMRRGGNMPLPAARTTMDPAVRPASADCYQAGGAGMGGMGGAGMVGGGMMGAGMPSGVVPTSYGHGPAYENPSMPGYAWPSYSAYPNYAALSYPQQYSPTAWPYIGPFYPYPQVPLAWRKVSLEWDDGWWFLDFSAHNSSH